MESMTIQKEFRWEMGHRLPNHEGKCRNLHGHSYRLVVEIEGEPDPATGMIVDFYEVSRAVKPLIETLDHAFLVQDSDEALRTYLDQQKLKQVVIPYPSTVENLCRHVADRVLPSLTNTNNISAVTFHIHETETSSASLRLAL